MLLNEINDDESLYIIFYHYYDVENYLSYEEKCYIDLYGQNFKLYSFKNLRGKQVYGPNFYGNRHNKNELLSLNYFKYKLLYFDFTNLNDNYINFKDYEHIVNKIIMHFCSTPDKIIIISGYYHNLDILINPHNKVYYNPTIKYKKNKIIIKSNN